MSSVPNVHVRDVPEEALDALRAAARRHGRSLNAELVAALVERAGREVAAGPLLDRLRAVRDELRGRHPDGLPPDVDPVAIIRRARDTG
jgi:plasmid stability protein